MYKLKIFSYLPNPRVWKSLIAGNICGVEVEVIGDNPANLGSWLWDFNPKKLDEDELNPDHEYARTGKRGFSGVLYKTDSFLKAHPFGTVPAAFSPKGDIGIFESNSILRAVARVGKEFNLYGKDPYEASRIDSFLDANLVFAREAQVYMLDYENVSKEGYERMTAAYEFYLSGIEAALWESPYIAGSDLSIADISFVCDFSQFLREGHYEDILKDRGLGLIAEKFKDEYPKTFKHLFSLAKRKEFSSVLGTYLDWYKTKLNI
jgi:elongation factor 1-gamma